MTSDEMIVQVAKPRCKRCRAAGLDRRPVIPYSPFGSVRPPFPGDPMPTDHNTLRTELKVVHARLATNEPRCSVQMARGSNHKAP